MGYLPGELALYGNMRASKFFEMYVSLQNGGGDRGYWKTLAERLDLDASRRIRQLSRGNRQKVGIVAAFMNQPDLLILDEPTSGLDPLMQQTVMALVREANASRRDRLLLLPHPARSAGRLRPGGHHPRGRAGGHRAGRGPDPPAVQAPAA